MAKRIVTHVNPDLDAITAIWLLVRFGGDEFVDSKLSFVPAGERLEGEDQNTVHVDTGLGKFDHHQPEMGDVNTSAAKLVYEWLVSQGRIQKNDGLRRLVDVVNDVDHFREFHWPEPVSDRYELFLEYVLNGVKSGGYVKSDEELVEFGMKCLDGVYVSFKIRIAAEKDFEKGISFETKWGRALAVESSSSGVVKFSLKKGYKVVVRRDPELGFVRIKAAPVEGIDLSEAHEKLRKADPEATWYFHPSGKMILNGSTRNPKMRPSKLGLDEVIEILKLVK
jgi:hypothetical protein